MKTALPGSEELLEKVLAHLGPKWFRLAAEQMQQYQHTLVRTQSSEHPDGTRDAGAASVAWPATTTCLNRRES
jgi:hypothetical protein